MRLKSEIFVAALVRRVFSAGDFAAVERKGADAAGAIFIRQRLRNGLQNLYGPAPQSFSDEEQGAERRFERRLTAVEGPEIDALIDKERRFDSDLWVVELETETVDELISVVAA